MVLNEHRGFVWSCDGDNITIQLRLGGKVTCANPDNKYDTGDRVCIIPDSSGKRVLEVLPEKDADKAVRCGIDPVFAANCREPENLPDEEEVLDDHEYHEQIDIVGIA